MPILARAWRISRRLAQLRLGKSRHGRASRLSATNSSSGALAASSYCGGSADQCLLSWRRRCGPILAAKTHARQIPAAMESSFIYAEEFDPEMPCVDGTVDGPASEKVILMKRVSTCLRMVERQCFRSLQTALPLSIGRPTP